MLFRKPFWFSGKALGLQAADGFAALTLALTQNLDSFLLFLFLSCVLRTLMPSILMRGQGGTSNMGVLCSGGDSSMLGIHK